MESKTIADGSASDEETGDVSKPIISPDQDIDDDDARINDDILPALARTEKEAETNPNS